MATGIKETLEILDVPVVVLTDAIEALKDGTVSAAEMEKMLTDVVTTGAAAVDGIQLVPEELKNLDIGEIVQLTMKGIQIGQLAFSLIKLLKK